MSITLRAVTRDNYEEVIHLQVSEHQQSWVGSITEFLARAYVKAEGYDYFPFAIYHEDVVVGFMLYMGAFGSADSHCIGGFLIDRRFQRKGYGRSALALLLRFVNKSRSCQKLTVTIHPGNSPARSLYESMGFQDQGWLYHGEAVLSKAMDG